MNQKKKKSNLWPLILCFAAAIAVFAVLLTIQKNALSEYEKAEVLVALKNVPENTEFTETNISEYFSRAEVYAKNVPAAAVVDMNTLVGKYATCNIDAGCMITKSMVTDLVPESNAGKVLLSIATSSLDQSVAGILRAGDVIDIYIIESYGDNTYDAIKLCEDVVIYRSYDSAGTVITKENVGTLAQIFSIPMETDKVDIFYEALLRGTIKIVKELEPSK